LHLNPDATTLRPMSSEPPPAYTPRAEVSPWPESTTLHSTDAHGINDRIRSLSIGTLSTHLSANDLSITTTGSPVQANDANVTRYRTLLSIVFGLEGHPQHGDHIVYYQIFSLDGAMESKCAFRGDDPYTGRIVASRITPPRTVELIKRCLCRQEGIPDVESTKLFEAVAGEYELGNEDRPPILARGGPGWSADDPMALIIKSASPSRTPLMTSRSHMVPFEPPRLRFSSNPIKLKHHTDRVRSIAISSDGTRLVSGSKDKTMFVWDTKPGNLKVVAGPILTSSAIHSVAFSPDRKQIVSGHNSSPFISIWDARTGAPLTSFLGHSSPALSISFSPNGRWIASGSTDNKIRIHDVQHGGSLIHTMEAHADWVRAVAFSADSSRLASGGGDRIVRLWDPRTSKRLAEPFKGHSNDINSVAFSPDGKWLASGSSSPDSTVRIWDLSRGLSSSTGLASKCWAGHTRSVTCVAFLPDGRYVLSGSWDGTVRIWDFQTGETVATLQTFGIQLTNKHEICSVVVSPKADMIVAGTRGGTIYVWRKV
jgi:WD40 repeat protein